MSRTAIRPTDCTLCLGVPACRQEYDHINALGTSDFLKQFPGGWDQYAYEFADELGVVEPLLRRYGLNINRLTTLKVFESVFKNNTKVVILFSHFNEDKVEFAGRSESVDDILSHIPLEFDGIVDLCVCHPERLVSELALQRIKCDVRYINVQATPIIWLHFYLAMFHLLRDGTNTYFDAMQAVHVEMAKQFRAR